MTNLPPAASTPPLDWEERRAPMIGRAAGLLLIAGMLLGFIPIRGYQSLYYSNPATSQIVDWAARSSSAIAANHFRFAWQATVWTIGFVLMVALLRGRGVLAALTYVGAGSFLALNWAAFGAGSALAQTARQTGSDAGVVALFNLAGTPTDGVSFAVAVASISALVLLTRRLPRVVGWLGIVVALAFFVGGPVDLVLEGTPTGIIGPVSTVLVVLWIVATGLLLLIKPIWNATRQEFSVSTPAVTLASHKNQREIAAKLGEQ